MWRPPESPHIAPYRSQRNLHPDTSQTQIQVTGEHTSPSLCGPPTFWLFPRELTLPSSRPEKPSITIRTVFSIVSNTINHTQSSSKAGISWAPAPGLREEGLGVWTPGSEGGGTGEQDSWV